MEEERVELLEEELEYAIRDNNSKNKRIYYVNAWDFDDLRMLLNQQDKEIKQLKRSKKQLAISELEKFKNYFDDKEDEDYNESEGWIITNRSVVEYIDNQIKELKGEEK